MNNSNNTIRLTPKSLLKNVDSPIQQAKNYYESDQNLIEQQEDCDSDEEDDEQFPPPPPQAQIVSKTYKILKLSNKI